MVELIHDCWVHDPKSRPRFPEIADRIAAIRGMIQPAVIFIIIFELLAGGQVETMNMATCLLRFSFTLFPSVSLPFHVSSAIPLTSSPFPSSFPSLDCSTGRRGTVESAPVDAIWYCEDEHASRRRPLQRDEPAHWPWYRILLINVHHMSPSSFYSCSPTLFSL